MVTARVVAFTTLGIQILQAFTAEEWVGYFKRKRERDALALPKVRNCGGCGKFFNMNKPGSCEVWQHCFECCGCKDY